MRVQIDNLDLKKIADSGQCFRLKELSTGIFRLHCRYYSVDVKQDEFNFDFSCSEDEWNTVWRTCLDIDTDYNHMIEVSDKEDTFLQEAIQYGKGIRILKQDLWETCVSFVISQNNNIPRIKKSIEALCERNNGVFPDYVELSSMDLDGLGLGYRDSYLYDLSKAYIKMEEDRVQLDTLSYNDSLGYLKQIKGIGDKVANCIILYGLGRFEACPIDTWMLRVIREDYNGVYPKWIYSRYAGYYQQLCFYYKRRNVGIR